MSNPLRTPALPRAPSDARLEPRLDARPAQRPGVSVRELVGRTAVSGTSSSGAEPDSVPFASDSGFDLGAPETLAGITDWYIPEDNADAATICPGHKRVPDGLRDVAAELLALARASCYRLDAAGVVIEILPDYRIQYRGAFLRGHRQRTVDGILHILRATAARVPEIRSLGLPAAVRNILCGQRIGDLGGLVILCGQAGHGKSTTCAAVLLERVKQFGSFCLAVEDPPEFPLNGEYPAQGGKTGKIVQVPAGSRSFGEDLRDALRCYPSNSRGSMLLVGEVRDADSAAQVLRAASNGQLVFMTTHAGDPIMAIERLLSLANASIQDPREAAKLLASSLRAVVHQRLQNGKLSASALFSMAADSSVAGVLRGGDPRLLSSELAHQDRLLENGMLEAHVLQASNRS